MFRVDFGNVLQGYVPGGKWVMVGYRFPLVRWGEPGRQREQIVLTFDQDWRVPFGACHAQNEHALLGHLGSVLRLDGTHVWTER